MRSSAGWAVEMPDACGQRSEMGDQEGFELDMEGTAEVGKMARRAVGVLGCGKG